LDQRIKGIAQYALHKSTYFTYLLLNGRARRVDSMAVLSADSIVSIGL